MANIKSAQKRISVNQKKAAQNKSKKSRINNTVKKFNKAHAEGKTELSQALYIEAESLLDSGATKNLIHKNKANRLKSTMAIKLNNPVEKKVEVKKAPAAKKTTTAKPTATKTTATKKATTKK